MGLKNLFGILAAMVLAGCVSLTPVSNNTSVSEFDFSKEVAKGESCQFNVLGIPFDEPPTVGAAAKEGRISRVAVISRRVEYYFIAAKQCIVVEGSSVSASN